jgi:hypothetical protein
MTNSDNHNKDRAQNGNGRPDQDYIFDYVNHHPMDRGAQESLASRVKGTYTLREIETLVAQAQMQGLDVNKEPLFKILSNML